MITSAKLVIINGVQLANKDTLKLEDIPFLIVIKVAVGISKSPSFIITT